MGCDYYLATLLVIEYNNSDSDSILIKEEKCYIANDDTIEEAINKRYYKDLIYVNGNWENNNEELIELYTYILEKNNFALYDIKSITKVVSGYRR
jgi:hypothetical protein